MAFALPVLAAILARIPGLSLCEAATSTLC